MIITFCTYFTETNDSTSFRPHCFIDLKCETISQWWLVNECFNHYPRKLIIKKLWPPKLLSKDLALTQPVESLECLYKKQTKWKKYNNASYGCSTKAFRAAGTQLPLQLVHVTVPWSLYRVQLWSTALESGLTLLWWLVASIWEKWEKIKFNPWGISLEPQTASQSHDLLLPSHRQSAAQQVHQISFVNKERLLLNCLSLFCSATVFQRRFSMRRRSSEWQMKPSRIQPVKTIKTPFLQSAF